MYCASRACATIYINAVLTATGVNDLMLVLYRLDALKYFLASDDGANLLTAYRRAANILRIEEKKDGRVADEDDQLFDRTKAPLHEPIGKEQTGHRTRIAANFAINAGRWRHSERARGRLLRQCHGQLRGPRAPQPAADAFKFDTLDRVADFSKIEG